MSYRIDRVRAEDGERCRTLRLQMLQDTPMAYLETYQDALDRPAEEWDSRAARNTKPGNTGYVAVDESTGAWVGAMHAYVPGDDPEIAWLVGVWVHPDHRGGKLGVTDRLLDAVVAWSRTEPAVSRMLLEVHESNTRAIAYYERRGFVRTGRTTPYPLDPTACELEMELPLG
ncbi:ribosomal protein S18 acetylase RimI-like enzyme [Streptacidiphilus sp. MAP12-16]|uniref:GNAT family N-acetyltransferase n=1 Tax=Streptacidiphilus sp. MAP12-16 TaxID=3156300 RepID=UPI003511C935